MEWFTALTELAKGLMGAEAAQKKGEVDALLQLFGLEGEVQRRKMAEEEMQMRREAHRLQQQLGQAQLELFPLQKSAQQLELELKQEQLQEHRDTASLRKGLLQIEHESAQDKLTRSKYEGLYEQGFSPDDIENDPAFTPEFKAGYKRYYYTRQFKDVLPVLKDISQVQHIIDNLPERARPQFLAMANFYIHENQNRDRLIQAQLSTTELQKYYTARTIAYDTLFTVINRTANWDKMKVEDRFKLLKKAVANTHLPPEVSNFFTDDTLKIFANMESETANMIRKEQVISMIRFAGQLRLLGEEYRHKRDLLIDEFWMNVAANALRREGGAGAGGQGGGQPLKFSPIPYVGFLNTTNSVNRTGKVANTTSINRYFSSLNMFDGQLVAITDERGRQQNIPFGVLKNQAHAALLGISEPSFYTKPNPIKAKDYFTSLIRYRYIELQLFGVAADVAFAEAVNQTEQLVNALGSPQLIALWRQYRSNMRK